MRTLKGSALLAVMFISLIALSISISMMQLSSTKTIKAANNKQSLKAFYAADAGINEALDAIADYSGPNDVMTDQPNAAELGLPTEASPDNTTLNGSEYYVSVDYDTVNNYLIVLSTGSYKGSAKRIRVKASLEQDDAFNFGLLSDKKININTGNIGYELDIHSNAGLDADGNPMGLDFQGQPENYTVPDDVSATQWNEDGINMSGATDEYGKWRKKQTVPAVDFAKFQSMFDDTDLTLGATDGAVSTIDGTSDLGNNVMFTEEYLNNNPNLDFSTLTLSSSKINNKPDHLIANNNYFKRTFGPIITGLKDNPLASFVLSALVYNINSNSVNSLCLNTLNNFKFITILGTNYSKWIYGTPPNPPPGQDDDHGNPHDTPVPTTVPPEPTPEPTAAPTPVPTVAQPAPTPEPTVAPPADNGNGNGNDNGNGNGNDNGNDNGTSNDNSNAGGSSNNLTLKLPAGDHAGRIYYIDNQNIGTLYIDLEGNVNNVVIVATGDVQFNGSNQNIARDSTPMVNVVIAAGGDFTHNGRFTTGALVWLNGNFTQNGSSDLENARVIAGKVKTDSDGNYVDPNGNAVNKSDEGIRLNGTFSLTTDYGMDDFEFLPKKVYIKSWQQIEVD